MTPRIRQYGPVVHVIDITDPADTRLDDFRDLNSSDRRPDLPEGKGLVIAEGVLVAQRLLASRFDPIALLGVDRRLEELADDLDGVDVPFYRTTRTSWPRSSGSTSTGVCSRRRVARHPSNWRMCSSTPRRSRCSRV